MLKVLGCMVFVLRVVTKSVGDEYVGDGNTKSSLAYIVPDSIYT